MNEVRFPAGYRIESLRREHPRKQFHCGVESVDDWLATKALQNHNKHLSATKVLVDQDGSIAGYYTLAAEQIACGDLPIELAKRLPRRLLPVAMLAWFGISILHQGKGLGGRLLARAMRDCYVAGQTFAFVAVILDCVNDAAKTFYQRWNFAQIPGHPYRLFLSTQQLEAMVLGEGELEQPS